MDFFKICTNLNPFIRGSFVPSLFENGPVVLKKEMFQMFLQFTVYLNPFPKDVLCSVWLKLAQWF